MPLTYTGRVVRPGGTTHPSLIDIAVGMSRQPRFAGQGKHWWSVLDHSLFCDELVKMLDGNQVAAQAHAGWRLAVLLHDAHEALTADVPTDFKGLDLKSEQQVLDIDIANTFFPGGWKDFNLLATSVKAIDHLALIAEAHEIGPPAPEERIVALFGTHADELAARVLLRGYVAQNTHSMGLPPYHVRQETHPAVREYLDRVLRLI